MISNDDYPKRAGIYKLTCIDNGKVYIGKSVNLRDRLNAHKRCCLKASGKYYLERTLIKHGWHSFTVDILEVFENFDKLKNRDMLLGVEAEYIKKYESTDKNKGYNTCKYSIDRTGVPHSIESRKRMSATRLGMRISDQTKEKISQHFIKLGDTRSKEHKEKMRLASIGNTNMLGVKHSDETKEKIRNARLGKKLSKETREKMRQSKIGTRHSDETKEKIRQTAKSKSNKEAVRSSD